MSLEGKVAIVTGSGRGLGLAYAQELARQGAAVVINDVDEATAADAVASIESAGGSNDASCWRRSQSLTWSGSLCHSLESERILRTRSAR